MWDPLERRRKEKNVRQARRDPGGPFFRKKEIGNRKGVPHPGVHWLDFLEEGKEYAMAVGWHCTAGSVRYWRGASGGTGPGFGEASGHFEVDDYPLGTSYGIGDEVTADYTGTSVFRANVALTDLDSESTTSCVD